MPSGWRWSLIGAGAIFAVGIVLLLFVYPSTHGPGSGRDVELALPGDDSNEQLAGRLAAAGLIEHPRLFMGYLRLTGGAGRVARGTHLLSDDLTPGEILDRIERRGRGAHVKVTIPEGWTRYDIGKRLQSQRVCSQKSFVDASQSPALLADLH